MEREVAVEGLDTPGFTRRLGECLADKNGCDPALAVVDHVRNMGGKTAVFEFNYVDLDYLDEHGVFYSKTHRSYSPRCTRVHFFRASWKPDQAVDLRGWRRGYLGFMVLRPTDVCPLGRTILSPPSQDPNREFYRCTASFSSHLWGVDFEVKGMPFMQQDTQVGRCAQASLWMLARYMSRRFGYREYLPAEINALAKAHMALGRALPAEWGLRPAQMLDALQGMGFSAIHYAKEALDGCSEFLANALAKETNAVDEPERKQALLSAKLADIAYRYIESDLPVILQSDSHAVVAIGHTYDHQAEVRAAIQRVGSFIVHDDEQGPYFRMPLWDQPARGMRQTIPFAEVHTVLAVVPQGVMLRGEDAESIARNAVRSFLESPLPFRGRKKNSRVKDLLQVLHPEFTPYFEGGRHEFEYRTYLLRDNEWQAMLLKESDGGGLGPETTARLLQLDYPKHLWVSEVSCQELLNHGNRRQRRCLGRVLVDSTAPAKTPANIATHLSDFCFEPGRRPGEKPRWIYEPGYAPFHHRVSG